MHDQDPMLSGGYENVRVISPEMSFEELGGARTAPPAPTLPSMPRYAAPHPVPAAAPFPAPAGAMGAPASAPQAAPPMMPQLAAQAAPSAPQVAVQASQPVAQHAPAEPVPGTSQTPLEMVRWREDLQVTAAPQERTVGTVRVRKYVTVEDFTGTIPIEYETVQVIREPVSPQEAALLTPADIAESTQEVELHTQEAVVTRRMVPIERVRLEISRVKGEATIKDTLRSEHFEVDEPSAPPNLQEAVRRVDAPYDGRFDHVQPGGQGTQGDQGKQQDGSKRRFGRRG